MDQLDLSACRALIEGGELLSDENVEAIRSEMYALAGVVVDAWDSLGETDQALLSPPGNTLDQLNAGLPTVEPGSVLDEWEQAYVPEPEQ